jgi:hypothetical protein
MANAQAPDLLYGRRRHQFRPDREPKLLARTGESHGLSGHVHADGSRRLPSLATSSGLACSACTAPTKPTTPCMIAT